MRELLSIPKIEINPNDTETSFTAIANKCGACKSCDGKKFFDVFICYREAADALIADRLYVYLKSIGIEAFLDKRSLPPTDAQFSNVVNAGKTRLLNINYYYSIHIYCY